MGNRPVSGLSNQQPKELQVALSHGIRLRFAHYGLTDQVRSERNTPIMQGDEGLNDRLWLVVEKKLVGHRSDLGLHRFAQQAACERCSLEQGSKAERQLHRWVIQVFL